LYSTFFLLTQAGKQKVGAIRNEYNIIHHFVCWNIFERNLRLSYFNNHNKF